MIEYDDKVSKILEYLAQGKSKKETAKLVGYKKENSMIKYMQRKGFCWDSEKKNYVPKAEESEHKKKAIQKLAPDKIQAIIDDLTIKETNPKDVAIKHGFKDHLNMTQYLKDKGYVWDPDNATYINTNDPFANFERSLEDEGDWKGVHMELDQELDQEQVQPQKQKQEQNRDQELDKAEARGQAICSSNISNEKSKGRTYEKPDRESRRELDGKLSAQEMEEYLPILEMIKEHKYRLKELLEDRPEVGELPRYIIPGRKINKAIYMSMELESLVVSYSKEKNVKQTEILEVALVEFFLKYGYEAEIKALLDK